MTWEDLVRQINGRSGYYRWLRIGFYPQIPEMPWMLYEIGEVAGVNFAENLFTVRLKWTAILHPFIGRWIWTKKPKDGGESAQQIDGDVTDVLPGQGRGGSFQIAWDIWHGSISHASLDPSFSSWTEALQKADGESQQDISKFEGGMWFLPKEYCGIELPMMDQILDPESFVQ